MPMFWKSLSLFLGLSVFVISPALAAESAVIRYSFLEKTLSVPELRKFSDTGELSPGLEANLRSVNQNPENFRTILDRPVPADAVLLSKILNNFIGESLLDYATEVIHTPTETSSRQALRGALILSALGDGEIQLIEVLENYPTSEVYIDGDRLVGLLNRMREIIGSLDRLPF